MTPAGPPLQQQLNESRAQPTLAPTPKQQAQAAETCPVTGQPHSGSRLETGVAVRPVTKPPHSRESGRDPAERGHTSRSTKLAVMQSSDSRRQPAGTAPRRARSAQGCWWGRSSPARRSRRRRSSRGTAERGKRGTHGRVPRAPGTGTRPHARGAPRSISLSQDVEFVGATVHRGHGDPERLGPTVPALLMAGRAPFSAHSRFPPKGTYCWGEGRLSVLSSCLRCLSRRTECTALRKSLRLLGELRGEGAQVRDTGAACRTADPAGSHPQTPMPGGQRGSPTPVSVPAAHRGPHSCPPSPQPESANGQAGGFCPRSCQIRLLDVRQRFCSTTFLHTNHHKALATWQSTHRQEPCPAPSACSRARLRLNSRPHDTLHMETPKHRWQVLGALPQRPLTEGAASPGQRRPLAGRSVLLPSGPAWSVPL